MRGIENFRSTEILIPARLRRISMQRKLRHSYCAFILNTAAIKPLVSTPEGER